jgi:hypothetical protein
VTTWALRFLVAGDRQTIPAMKLICELTGNNLGMARAAVQHQLVFAEGLDHAAAMAIVDRFARETQSTVELIEPAEYRYAFDPRHPLRGDQPLLRLRRLGPTLAWEQGRIGEWTRERDAGFDSADACEQAIANECGDWAALGLEQAEREIEIVRRTSARELLLEQAIREADDPDEPMAIHADWLQRQGDPRGVVAALDLARAHAESPQERARLDQAFAEALTQHRAHLFGRLHGVLDPAWLTWRGGMVLGASIHRLERVDPDRPRPFGDLEIVEDLLALPICACLRSLHVNSVLAGPTLTRKLMASDPALLAGLRELAVLSTYAFEGFRDWSLLPRLERLELILHEMAPMDLPRLRELDMTVSWYPQLGVSALREAKLPSLRNLKLSLDANAWARVSTEPLTPGMFEELLALPILASLETLAWRSIDEPWRSSAVQNLIDAPALRGIGRVDLREVEFESDARAQLFATRARLPNFVID